MEGLIFWVSKFMGDSQAKFLYRKEGDPYWNGQVEKAIQKETAVKIDAITEAYIVGDEIYVRITFPGM